MNERVKTSSRYQSLCRCEENEHREMNFNSYSGPDGPPSLQRKKSPLLPLHTSRPPPPPLPHTPPPPPPPPLPQTPSPPPTPPPTPFSSPDAKKTNIEQ